MTTINLIRFADIMIELDKFEKFIFIFLVFSLIFDYSSTLYFSRLIGIEGEQNIIVKFLIQNEEWVSLTRLIFLEVFAIIPLISICLYFRRKYTIKYYEIMIMLIPLMRIYGGFTWIYAYFF